MVFAAPCSSSASSSSAAPSASASLFAPILVVPVVRGQHGRDDDASLRLSSAPPAVQRWALVPSVGHLVHRFAYCIATRTLQQFLTCRQSEPGHCERKGFYIWQEGPVGLTQVVLNALSFCSAGHLHVQRGGRVQAATPSTRSPAIEENVELLQYVIYLLSHPFGMLPSVFATSIAMVGVHMHSLATRQ